MVAKVGDKLYSIYDGKTEYTLGQTMTQPVAENHQGGFYVYPTMRQAFFADVPFNKGGLYTAPRTLIVCMCWGEFIEYGNGKIAFEKLCPIKEIGMQSGYLATKDARRNIESTMKEADLKKQKSFMSQMKTKVMESHHQIVKPASRIATPLMMKKGEMADKTTSELLKDQNDVMEREIKEMEKRLKARKRDE